MDLRSVRTVTVLAFAAIGTLGGALAFRLLDYAPITVVATTALLCAVIGVYAARPRFGWLYTLLLVPLGGALNAAVNLFLTCSHSVAAHYLLQGMVIGVVCSLPFLPALLLMGWMTRRIGRARPGSLVAGVYARRVLWCFALVAACGGVFIARLSSPALATGTLVAAAAVACLVALGVRSLMVWLKVEELSRLAAFLRPTQSDTPPQRDENYVDLGVGETQYVYVEPASLLRGTPAARLLIEGDPAQALPVARNAALLAGSGFFLALAALLAVAVR